MSKRDQQKIFNDALAVVTKTNRELADIYKLALVEIEKELASFQTKIEKGLLNDAQSQRQARLLKLQTDINTEINTLYKARTGLILNIYVDVEIDSYYKMAYSIEKDVNKFLIDANYDYIIGYPRVSRSFVRKTYTDLIIGGYTFPERERLARLSLQGKIRGLVNQATQDGLTVKEVAQRLGEVDDVFKTDLARAQTTARTELLRGHSIAQENSIIYSKAAGVEGREIWDATLDNRTRPAHAAKDQTEPDEDGLFRFPDGSAAVGPRMEGLSAAMACNCRCTKIYSILDVEPLRGGRKPDGSWSTEFGGKDWNQWAADQEAAGTIDEQTKKKLIAVRKIKSS